MSGNLPDVVARVAVEEVITVLEGDAIKYCDLMRGVRYISLESTKLSGGVRR